MQITKPRELTQPLPCPHKNQTKPSNGKNSLKQKLMQTIYHSPLSTQSSHTEEHLCWFAYSKVWDYPRPVWIGTASGPGTAAQGQPCPDQPALLTQTQLARNPQSPQPSFLSAPPAKPLPAKPPRCMNYKHQTERSCFPAAFTHFSPNKEFWPSSSSLTAQESKILSWGKWKTYSSWNFLFTADTGFDPCI